MSGIDVVGSREYGIPAVVGAGDATARPGEGQLVTVDGGAGTVEVSLPTQQHGGPRSSWRQPGQRQQDHTGTEGAQDSRRGRQAGTATSIDDGEQLLLDDVEELEL